MTHAQPAKRLTITLPKRKCANPACGKVLPESHPRHFTTCSWACKLAVDRELAEIEAADKLPQEQPF